MCTYTIYCADFFKVPRHQPLDDLQTYTLP